MLDKLMCLIAIVKITDSTALKWNSFDLKSIPDYVDSVPAAKKIDIRENFVKKKIQRNKAQDIDRFLSKFTGVIYVDKIAHFDVNKNSIAKADEIEADFKNLLSMKSMKYVYKRGFHWRTWRQISDASGKKKIIFYKCHNRMLPNCTTCDSSGFWEIEDVTPPCPYEIFSLAENQEICAVNYTRLNKIIDCPTRIRITDLTRTCDNPIVTVWRFTRNYAVPERKSVICGGRDFCEVSTLYQIQNNKVIFRIVNASEIIYSRVMKHNHRNYVCVQDCGIINLSTFKIKPNDRPVLINLLATKEKTENKL